MFPPHRYYYLHNFQRALAWVAERYDDVLDEPQRRFVADYAALPQPSQALLARLLLRRGPWFRASGLIYEEIGPAETAAAPLEALGWLDRDAAMTPDELFGLHTKPELLRLFPHLPASARKAELLDALRARQPDAKPYRDWHPDAGEAVWRLMAGEVCERFRLMFFGNLHQDWSEFVLADLGVFQYERAFRRGLARIPVARRRGPLPGFACLPRGWTRRRRRRRARGWTPCWLRSGLRQRQSLAGAAPRQGAAAHRPGLRTGGRLAGGGTGVRAMRLSGRAPPPHPRARTHDIAARGAGAGGTGPGRA